MTDHEHAESIRAMCKSLGHEIPGQWTDDNVIEFFNTLSNDSPHTDMMDGESICAGALLPGDVLRTNETVVFLSCGLNTPSRKIDIVLQKGARLRVVQWNKATRIWVERRLHG